MDRSIINDYLDYMYNIREKSQNTIDGYRVDLNLLFDYLNSRNIKSIEKIKLQDLHGFIAFCNQRGDATSTRARRVASIKSFFNYLCDIVEVIKVNPSKNLKTPKQEKKNPEYLSLNEAERLLEIIDGDYKERDYAIITLFLNCGLRLSELVSIDLDKIKGDTLTVVGKGNKERTIYLNETCLDAISQYLKVRPDTEKDSKALFISKRYRRISDSMVQHLVKDYMAKAGLDISKVSTHSLRHSAATLMYKYGNVDIRALQQILGHSNMNTTQIYTHVDNEQCRKAVSSNPLNKKKINA